MACTLILRKGFVAQFLGFESVLRLIFSCVLRSVLMRGRIALQSRKPGRGFVDTESGLPALCV